MDRRPGGGHPPRRHEGGGEGRHRTAQGAAAPGAFGAIARRAALVRACRHRQRSDELWLADAGRRRGHRAEPRRRPRLRREAAQRAEPDPLAARPPLRPVTRLPHDQHRAGPRARWLEWCHRRGHRPLGRGGHFLQSLRGPQLLARPQDRHRLPGAGRDPLPDHGHARKHRDGADSETRPGSADPSPRCGAGPPGNDAGRIRPLQHEAIGEPDRQHRR